MRTKYKDVKVITSIVRNLEDEAIEFETVGDSKSAERNRILASKYKQMEYNGHLTVYDRIRDDK
jgi:hypothetical protein|tara:strand:+ start:1213 stop:1404 length:192 start_codon:yes stop_codon:yes gene_type:complete